MVCASAMTSVFAIGVLLNFFPGGVLAAGLTPADTVAADLSQLLFPQPAIAAVDPRRQLSLQQQTQILTDVQQHHQQQQSESSLYTTRIEFGGESQSATTSTQKPFVYTQQTQFSSKLHKSEDVPSPQTSVRHSIRQGHRSSRFELNRSRSQPVTEATTTESTKQSPQQKLRSLRRRPALDATTTAPEPESRPRARLIDEEKETDFSDQVYLQNERQQLLQQLKEYNQQQKRLSAQREKLLAEQPQKSEGLQESRAVPQIQSLSNDNPLKAQDTKTSTLNPLRKQQQQQQLQAQLQKQFQQQFIQRQELIRKLKQALSNAPPSASSGDVPTNPNILTNNSSPVFLANGQKLQVLPSPRDEPSLSFLTQDNSEPAQSIAARSAVVLPQTTEKPPGVIFQELTQGVLPPGAQFEVIRHKQDGGLESVGDLPANLPNKKVTFVFLEEQPDGTVKVQGVRGNNEGQGTPEEANPAVDVDSIIEKIQKGDLKLPPSAQLAGNPSVPTGIPVLETTPQESVLSPTFISRSSLEAFATTQRPNSLLTISSTVKPSQSRYSTLEHSFNGPDTEFIPSITIPTQTDPTNTQSPFILSDTQFGQKKFTPSPSDTSPVIYNNPFGADGKNAETLFVPASSSQSALSSRNHFSVPNQSSISHKTSQKLASSIYLEEPSINPITALPILQQKTHTHFSPTPSPITTVSSTPSPVTPPPSSRPTTSATRSKPQRGKFVPTVPTPQEDASGSEVVRPVYKRPESDEDTHGSPTVRSVPKSSEVRQNVVFPNAPEYRFSANSTKSSRGKSSSSSGSSNSKLTLSQVLKKEGLFAMAKFLRESGLDSILNDTGPYTVFVPTDKAFRALLIQLGGPDKAEEKFRENPRLLSGLLLHHVIPGAFKLNTLQDEMTGISLAGTQLRVNTYNTQDVEWNDVKVTTINGARIQRDQNDIDIPQGVAHAVDRVMFPLPVGDVMQTLQADRERRFAKFLRSVEASGLSETLSGTRTFTVFAPTDRAFTAMGTAEQLKVQAEREAARTFVQRHIVPGTLYSAGMRYYQVRPSLDPDHAVTIVKNAGQLKANNAHVIAHNIPATNGVIHVTDTIIL